MRHMFMEGERLRKERGAWNVYDYSIGNPEVEPPARIIEALQRVVTEKLPGMHRYMPNAGFPQVREVIARQLRKDCRVGFTADDVFMTAGAAGAINIILRAVLDEGDEVIVLSPYFQEYPFYISNHGARMVCVETDEEFVPDVERIADAITVRTKAILLNTPNNPSGRAYPENVLRDLNSVLVRARHPIVVISDEPYKHFLFDGRKPVELAAIFPNCAICNSASKSQALPGERIGYLALSPRMAELAELRNACTFTMRTLGFVNASALWQLVLAEAHDAIVDVRPYQEKRDLLCDALAHIGYEVTKPEGSLYVFLKSPIADDVAFVRLLAAEGVLGVPGTGFGRSGYLRLSLTVPREMIKRSLGGFEKAFHRAIAQSIPA